MFESRNPQSEVKTRQTEASLCDTSTKLPPPAVSLRCVQTPLTSQPVTWHLRLESSAPFDTFSLTPTKTPNLELTLATTYLSTTGLLNLLSQLHTHTRSLTTTQYYMMLIFSNIWQHLMFLSHLNLTRSSQWSLSQHPFTLDLVLRKHNSKCCCMCSVPAHALACRLILLICYVGAWHSLLFSLQKWSFANASCSLVIPKSFQQSKQPLHGQVFRTKHCRRLSAMLRHKQVTL